MFWAKANLDRTLWNKHDGDGTVLAPWQSMVSGFTAAVLGPTATGPFDVVKTRLMADSSYTGFVDCLGKSVRQGGVLSLYRGWTPVSEERACSAWSRVPSRY